MTAVKSYKRRRPGASKYSRKTVDVRRHRRAC